MGCAPPSDVLLVPMSGVTGSPSGGSGRLSNLPEITPLFQHDRAEVCLAVEPSAFLTAARCLLAEDLLLYRILDEISFNHVQEISSLSLSSQGQLEENPEGDKNQILDV